MQLDRLSALADERKDQTILGLFDGDANRGRGVFGLDR